MRKGQEGPGVPMVDAEPRAGQWLGPGNTNVDQLGTYPVYHPPGTHPPYTTPGYYPPHRAP